FSGTTDKQVTDGAVFYLQDVSDGLPLTSANTLATVTVSLTSNGCVAIVQQPSDQTVGIGQPTTFSVSASGDPTLTYQWQRNGINISGANSASYTTPAATSADNGTQFSCVVGNSFGSVTSQSASLNVTVTITLTTNPGGLLVTWDGQQNSTPFSVTSIIGASHTLAVVSPQTLN